MNLVGVFRALATTQRRVAALLTPGVRGVLVSLIALAGGAYYLDVVRRHYPVEQWLFWSIGVLWCWVLLFNVACLGAGYVVLRALGFMALPRVERAVLAMALGVVTFTLAMYAGGALALFGPVFSIALALLFIAGGARELWRAARDARAAWSEPVPRDPLVWAATVFGILCVGLLYLGVMTPDALNHDAGWCHLTVPQDYAREGRIVPFLADYSKNVPQLTGLVHTWGFSLPGLDQPHRWMLALHTEFSLFLWTLAGVVAAVRWAADDPKLRGSWAAFFLFPYIFVYDHNLGGAADHVLAFFALPLLLSSRHFAATLSPGSAALFGSVAAGAVLTKYQAIYLLAPLGALLGVRWALVAFRAWRASATGVALGEAEGTPRIHPRWPYAPLIAGAAAVLVSSPHFVKNLIFFKNPVYPLAENLFSATWPTVPRAQTYIPHLFSDSNWIPKGSFGEKLLHAFELFFSFSFEPHYSLTKYVPGFGSLFTLLLPAVLFVPRASRVLYAAALASGGLIIWGLTYNVDRNLQTILPIMVCVTAALTVKIWRLGWLARAGLVPLVALQLVWGGDAFFYESYTRVQSAMSLIRSGFEGKAKTRLDGYRRDYRAIGRALPKDARVLMHSWLVNLGINRQILLDWPGLQGFVNYSSLHTPRELFDYYESLGITHLLYVPDSHPIPSYQDLVLWEAFIGPYGVPIGTFGVHRLYRMPSEPPPATPPFNVASFGVNGYADGLYPIATMNALDTLPPHLRTYASPAVPLTEEEGAAERLLGEAHAALFGSETTLEQPLGTELGRWTLVEYAKEKVSVYLRKP